MLVHGSIWISQVSALIRCFLEGEMRHLTDARHESSRRVSEQGHRTGVSASGRGELASITMWCGSWQAGANRDASTARA